MGALDAFFDMIGELLSSVFGFIVIAIVVIGGIIGLATGGAAFGLSESKRKKVEANAGKSQTTAQPQTKGKTQTPVKKKDDQGKNILKGCLIAAIVAVIVVIIIIFSIMNAFNSAFN